MPSVFETTIRWVGGLISAYELSDEKYPILITKAKEVTDKLAYAWVGVRLLILIHQMPRDIRLRRTTPCHITA
jgi:hypothetical protein